MSQVFRLQCENPWFDLLRSGVKPVEGRKNSPKYHHIQPGDTIEFLWQDEIFWAHVIDVRRYDTLEAYLQDVTIQKALPGVSSLDEALRIYYQWNTPQEILKYGFLGVFIEPIAQR